MFIKNDPSTPEAPIPPSTLSQAGTLSVSTSTAWDSKAVMSAWWVTFDQVTKTLPTGDYVTGNNFVIRGTKNYLPPAQLVLGFGVLFQISDESKAKHLKHRLQNEEDMALQDDASALQEGEAKEGDGPEMATQQDDPSDESDDEDFPDAKLESGSEDDEPATSEPAPAPNQRPSLDKPDIATLDVGKLRIADDDHKDSSAQRETVIGAAKEGSNQSGDNLDAAPEQEASEQGDEDSDDAFDPEPTEPPATNQPESTKNPESATKKPAPVRHVRGKRGKKKKLATKYKDQDEEDRELAMKLLGSAAAQAKAQEEAQTKQARDEAREAQKQRRREQHLRAAWEGLAHEERRRTQGDKDIENEDEDEKEEPQRATAILSNLVGTPLPGDEILSAIPVCAPWSALAKYKYKAKLQPGSTKKGKAVKEILGRWLLALNRNRNAGGGNQAGTIIDEKSEDVERFWPRELELIKGWKESEIFNVVPVGKIKVVMSSSSSGGGKGADASGKRKGGGGGKGKGGRGGKGSKRG